MELLLIILLIVVFSPGFCSSAGLIATKNQVLLLVGAFLFNSHKAKKVNSQPCSLNKSWELAYSLRFHCSTAAPGNN
jgi:hypothetical protein